MSKIEAELLKATGLKAKKNEDRQDYLDRLIKAVQNLEDDEWEKISKAGQDWTNKGASAVNAEEEIPDFTDAKAEKNGGKSSKAAAKDEEEDDADGDDDAADDGDDSEDDDAEEENEEEDEKVSKRGKGSKTAASKKDAKSKKGGKAEKVASSKKDTKKDAGAKDKKTKPERKERKGGGAQVMIKKAVIKDPSVTTEKIVALLEKAGLNATLSGVSTIRSGTLQTLRLIKELGMPKGEI